MALPPKWYQFLISLLASLGSLLYGYDLGVIAEAIASPSFNTRFSPNSKETGAIVSVFTGGAFFGAAVAGYTGDSLGRKYTILIGALIFCLGGGLQTGAANIHYLYAGRAIAGLGVGVLTMIVPLYQAELCHPSIRGRVTALQQFMLGVGALVASWVSYGTYVGFADDDDRQWRVSLGLQVLPAGILAILILGFPESPRWLLSQDRQQEGLETLARLHSSGDTNDAFVQAEYGEILRSIEVDRQQAAKSYVELFSDPASVRRLLLACAIQGSVQMTGVSAIQYYSVEIYSKIGIKGNDTLKYQAISSVIALVAQFLCMMFIDRFGRRTPLIIGNLGNCVTFIIATILLAKFPPGSDSSGGAAGWGFIAMTWLYNFCFSATCGPLSWIIPAEIFDTRTRAKGVAIAAMISFGFNTMIGQTTSVALDDKHGIGWKWYILFIVCNFTNAVFFWAVLPETAKRPLEEMRYLFSEAPWFVPGRSFKRWKATDAAMTQENEKEQHIASVEHKETSV